MERQALDQAQEYLRLRRWDGWLLYDYRGSNPAFTTFVGPVSLVTRPAWCWVPARGEPRLLVHAVDAGRFAPLGLPMTLFSHRLEMVRALQGLLRGARRVAMEYSPKGLLPRASRVDAGTLELVRSLGVQVLPSADLVQYALLRWTPAQVEAHRSAARKLGQAVREAFDLLCRSSGEATEWGLALFLRRRMEEMGLETRAGPIVAVNRHSSDPHYEPVPETSLPIRPGDWLLLDLWARERGPNTPYADITWVAYVGPEVPERYRQTFQVVARARDTALEFITRSFREGRPPAGWQVDRAARQVITRAGYGRFFTHRLGHSLGTEDAHGEAVNLDSWETRDTRRLLPGLAVTIEPGVYLPDFGVRSEINVYLTETGPEVTTEVQREVVAITAW